MAKLVSGSKAPAFSLPDQTGKPVSLSAFAGKKVLLYFYPRADTPGCTRQACSVRDNLSALRGHGVEPLGVSPDGPADQRKFDEKYSLGFPLLCDTTHEAAEAYGVWSKGITRSAFLIDERGAVAAAWYGVKPEETVPHVLQYQSEHA